MCGIGGVLKLDGSLAEEQDLKRMIHFLKHRGPDGSGYHLDKELGLANTRLAILDLSPSGNQPMSYGNERYWITYNGEIYNFLEIRKSLEDMGYEFRSDCDTEVVLASYSAWGPSCLLKFNGMWAFALWDSKERKLFLSRDRFGVKPLYYYKEERFFAFSSEVKGFLGLQDCKVAYSPEGLATSFEFVTIMDGMEITAYRNIFRLLPGHSLEISLNAGPKITRWWRSLDHLPEVSCVPHIQNQKLLELLYDSCKLRMRSDVSIGTSLSGGLDSSCVFGVLNSISKENKLEERRCRGRYTAFILRFPHFDNLEQKFAEEFVLSTGQELQILDLVPEDALERIRDIIYSYEGFESIFLGPWMLYKLMKQEGVAVSLDGHGADECLGGYFLNALRDVFELTKELLQTSDLVNKIGSNPEAWSLLVKNRQVPGLSKLAAMKRTLPKTFSYAQLDRKHLKGKPLEYFSPVWEEDFPLLEDMNAPFLLLYHQAHGGFLQWILRTYDLASMAHGVEVRAPFLDWRLFCYCLALPQGRKIGKGFTKLALREALEGLVPKNILRNPRKRGFSPPMGKYFSNSFRHFMLEVVKNRDFLESDLWDGSKIAQELDIGFLEEGIFEERKSNPFYRAWPYVQIYLLSDLFRKKRKDAFELTT